jgi:hypothetical protein
VVARLEAAVEEEAVVVAAGLRVGDLVQAGSGGAAAAADPAACLDPRARVANTR